MPSSCALFGRFAIGSWVSLLWQHNAEREMLASACTRSVPGRRLSRLTCVWRLRAPAGNTYYHKPTALRHTSRFTQDESTATWICLANYLPLPSNKCLIATSNSCSSVIPLNDLCRHIVTSSSTRRVYSLTFILILECGPMPNVMAALPNIGGTFCSTPQSFAWRPLLECRAVTLPRRETRWN